MRFLPISRPVGAVAVAFSVCALGCAGPRRAASPLAEPPAPLRLPVHREPTPPVADKFEAGLEARLRSAPAGRRVTVMVDLSEQIDLEELARRVRSDPRPRRERRASVVEAYEQLAARQQGPLLRDLSAWIEDGRLDFVAPVAIVNRLVVEGPATGILELAERTEIVSVLAEWHSRRAGNGGLSSGGSSPEHPGERFVSWAIDALGVGAVWEAGYDGSGVIVAAIDTGARADHEQLRDRRVPGERGWFDPVEGSTTPSDGHGHGTSVLVSAVGANRDGRVAGVAPGASWAMALGNYGNFYSRVRMTLAADWVLRVARPDVLINAWSHDEEPCAGFDLPFIDAWKAAGIFVVFPAGNRGPDEATGESPAQLGGTFPDGGPVFAVAGLDPDGTVHDRSSRGPSVCGSHRFPAAAAPGAELPVATNLSTTGYFYSAGTSLAAGLVGGAAALLLQADPDLEPWELEAILTQTARDLPPRGHDPASGAGAIWLPAALEQVLRAREGERSR